MKNIAETINAYLATEIPGLPVIYNDVFPTPDNDSVICRYDPSQAYEKRFCDGTRSVSQQFAFYSRSTNAKTARNYLDEIINVLDTEQLIRVTDSLSIECEAVTLPQFVSVDDNNNAVYTASVQIEYLETQE